MNLSRFTAVLAGAFALVFSGCVTSHSVRVDALSTGDSRGGTYILASATEGVDEGDLFFKEIARFLQPALANQRFYPAKEGQDADLLIEVDAYLSEPMTESEHYSEPIYMETRGYYRTIRIPVMDSQGRVVRYTYSGYWTGPSMHMAGWVDNERQVTVYDKVLGLSARKVLGADSYSDEIWAVTIAMRGESTDYRAALPYMLVAAEPYIGGRTEGEEIIQIREDSEDVAAYKSALANVR